MPAQKGHPYFLPPSNKNIKVWRYMDFANRQGFSHRVADDKSLLDEVLRRGRGERGRLGWDGCCEKVGWTDWVAGLNGI